jgi:light-regulated signal transduction histidine kinase (bacteriophytochrome)
MSVSGEPIFGANGHFRGYRGVGRSITARKRTEVGVQTLNAELERRVAELDAAHREMESFTYSVSHDLRSPLRALDGFSRMLVEEHGQALDEEARAYLARISTNAQLMGQLIDGLLDLSRTMRARMLRHEVDLSRMASEVVAGIRQADREREVDFVIAPQVLAEGDPTLLRIVLHNLLSNAWKFTQKRALARIEFGTAVQEGGRVFFVRDDGVGFDMAYADKLFGAFQRLHGVAEFAGTGIGLVTVQRIVQRHGGRAWAEGALGRGATFYFTLRPAPAG